MSADDALKIAVATSVELRVDALGLSGQVLALAARSPAIPPRTPRTQRRFRPLRRGTRRHQGAHGSRN
jgi:hypothetical protein